MSDNESAKTASNPTQPEAEPSPSEKLEGDQPTGSLVPGAENPDSEEIKNEVNPNTE